MQTSIARAPIVLVLGAVFLAAPAHAGTVLVVDTTAVDFGVVQVGDLSPAVDVHLENQGGQPITLSCIGGGVTGGFAAAQSCQGATLDPGESCAYTYRFAPTASGAASEVSSFSCNARPFEVELAGTGVAPILVTRSTDVDFGGIPVGASSPAVPVPIANQGLAPVVVSCMGGGVAAPFSAAQNCQGAALDPGESCHFFYTLSPTSVGGVSTTSSFSCNGKPAAVELAGAGRTIFSLAELRLERRSVDFGPVQVGTTGAPAFAPMRNANATGAIAVSCSGGGVGSPFSGAQSCQGANLDPGESCDWIYQFTPTQVGPVSAQSSFTCSGSSFTVDLVGEGVAPVLTASRTEIDFGYVPAGSVSPPIVVDVTNQGLAPLTLSCTGGAAPPPFSSVQSCQSNLLDPGESCALTYRFAPSSDGAFAGSVAGACNGNVLAVSMLGVGGDVIFVSDFEGGAGAWDSSFP